MFATARCRTRCCKSLKNVNCVSGDSPRAKYVLFQELRSMNVVPRLTLKLYNEEQ